MSEEELIQKVPELNKENIGWINWAADEMIAQFIHKMFGDRIFPNDITECTIMSDPVMLRQGRIGWYGWMDNNMVGYIQDFKWGASAAVDITLEAMGISFKKLTKRTVKPMEHLMGECSEYIYVRLMNRLNK